MFYVNARAIIERGDGGAGRSSFKPETNRMKWRWNCPVEDSSYMNLYTTD